MRAEAALTPPAALSFTHNSGPQRQRGTDSHRWSQMARIRGGGSERSPLLIGVICGYLRTSVLVPAAMCEEGPAALDPGGQ